MTNEDELLVYAETLRAAVDAAADDGALLAQVRGFDGGRERLLRFLADGMALAFNPELAAGETGLVQFVIEDEDGTVDLWLQIDLDGCRRADEGPDPDAVIEIPLVVFLQIAFKRMSGADAYIDGLVSATGDIVLATALSDWFDPPDLAMARVRS
jgi:alkyl sulfatase BDS1-like metallo-beta-lactamase superfamily hydrolase